VARLARHLLGVIELLLDSLGIEAGSQNPNSRVRTDSESRFEFEISVVPAQEEMAPSVLDPTLFEIVAKVVQLSFARANRTEIGELEPVVVTTERIRHWKPVGVRLASATAATCQVRNR